MPTDKELFAAFNAAVEWAKVNNATRPSVAMIKEALGAFEKVRWQPIETAPKDGTEILITNGYELYTAKYRKSNVVNDKPFFAKSVDGNLWNDGYDHELECVYMHKPTHWMRLPQPQREGE